MNLVVSLHDVHPGSLGAVSRQRQELRTHGVRRVSLLVVPYWHRQVSVGSDPKFLETLSQWRDEGDEIVLHGWTHSIEGLHERASDWFWTRLYTSREAEFHLASPEETRVRLITGRELFEHLGWPCVGFIAPAWLMAPCTTDILRELGFAYTVTRQQVVPLGMGTTPIASTSLCYSTRSAWRRAASRLWNPALARSLRHSPLLRLSLHPGDIVYPNVWYQILRLTKFALKSGRTAQNYRDCVSGQIISYPSGVSRTQTS